MLQHGADALHPAAPHGRVFPQGTAKGSCFSKCGEHHFPLLSPKTETHPYGLLRTAS